MVFVAIAITGISTFFAYKTTLKSTKFNLQIILDNRITTICTVYQNTHNKDSVINFLKNWHIIHHGTGITKEYTYGELLNDTLILFKNQFDKPEITKEIVSYQNCNNVCIKNAVSKKNGFLKYKDYRGKYVYSTYKYIPEINWGISVKMDSKEIFQPLYNTFYTIILISLLTAFMASIWYFFINEKNIKKIKNSEIKYRSRLDNMLEGCQIIGNDWKYIYINKSAERQNKRTKDEIIGKKFQEVWPEVENPELYKNLNQTLFEKIPLHFEYKFTFPDNSIGWFDLSIQPVPEGVFILSIDITERKIASEKIRFNEEKFKTILGNVQDIFYQTDLEGNIIEISPSISKYTDFIRDELIGKSVSILYYDLNDRLIFLNKIKEKGVVKDYEIKIKSKNKSFIYVSVNAQLIYNSENQPDHIDGSLRDITERKKTEEILKSSEDSLNEAQEIAKMGSWYYNFQTEEYVWSKNNYKIANINPAKQKITLNDFLKMVYPDDINIILKNIDELRDKKKTVSFDFRIILQNSQIRWLQNTILPLFEKDIIIGMKGVNIDITDKKQLEQDLLHAKDKAEKSNQLKTAFLNNISHEIRTPLNGIIGFGELIMDKNLTEEEKREYYSILGKSSDRLLKTITDIMDISMLISGNTIPQFKTFNLNEILNEIYTFSISGCKEKNLILSLLFDKNQIIYLKSDDQLLKKSILHLTDNAIKYTSSGSVTIGFEIQTDHIAIFVSDTGIGIKKDVVESLFDIFMQEDLSSTRGYEGSGLGLTIANQMVKLINGKIEIESEKSKGSTFKIILPLSQIVDTEIKKEILNVNPLKTKILVAEDDDDNFFLIETIFDKHNLQFIRASNGEEAIEIVEKNNDIALVLMDLKMPKINGFEATKKIKSINKNIPVIAVSAYTVFEDVNFASNSGCDDYIEKPINKNIFKQKLEKFGIKIN